MSPQWEFYCVGLVVKTKQLFCCSKEDSLLRVLRTMFAILALRWGSGCIVMALSGIAYFSIHILGSSIDSTLQVSRWFILKLSMKCRLVSKVILCLPSLEFLQCPIIASFPCPCVLSLSCLLSNKLLHQNQPFLHHPWWGQHVSHTNQSWWEAYWLVSLISQLHTWVVWYG